LYRDNIEHFVFEAACKLEQWLCVMWLCKDETRSFICYTTRAGFSVEDHTAYYSIMKAFEKCIAHISISDLIKCMSSFVGFLHFIN